MDNIVWKNVKGFEDYKVSNTGEVFSMKRNVKLHQYEHKNYLGVYLYSRQGNRKFMFVHRLVALNFIENPDNLPQINHKDENSKNNNVKNLEWCSAKYNSNYGLHNKKISIAKLGEKNHFYGKHHSDEAKQKMRLAKLGKELTSEHKKKIGLSNKGKGRIGTPVYCLELGRVFKNALEAERQTGISNVNINQVCREIRKTAGGYHWQFEKKGGNKND